MENILVLILSFVEGVIKLINRTIIGRLLLKLLFFLFFFLICSALISLLLFFLFPKQYVNNHLFFSLIGFVISILGTILIIKLFKNIYRKKSLRGKPKKRVKKSTEYLIKIGKTEIYEPHKHIAIIGGSGSGKTKFILEPYLKEIIKQNYCGVVFDYKSPTIEKFVRYWHSESNCTTQIKSLNLTNGEYSNRFNILKNITSPLHARELATSILTTSANENKDFFVNSSISLLTAVIYNYSVNNYNNITFSHIVSLFLTKNVKEIINIIKNPISIQLLRPIIDSLESEKQLAGITASLNTKLTLFLDPNIFFVLSGKEAISLNETDNPKLLIISSNPQLEMSINPIISSILNICCAELNRENKHKSTFCIDELATIFIPKLNTFLATCRSNKVSACLSFQDISQMNIKYTKDGAGSILSNMAYQFFGRNTNGETIKYIKELFGNYHVTMNLNENQPQNNSIHNFDKITNEEIMNLNAGDFFTMSIDKKINQDIFKDEKYLVVQSNDIEIQKINDKKFVENEFYKIQNEVEKLF